jgi:hypothetical protein
LQEVLNIGRECYPRVFGLLIKRDGRGREIGIVEGPNGNTVVMGPDIRGPADRASTSRAEVVLKLPTLLRVADIDPVLSLKVDGGFREVGIRGQRHARAPLASLTVADVDGLGFAQSDDAKPAALAFSNSGHWDPIPLSARLL